MAATRILAALALGAGIAVAQASAPPAVANDAESHFLSGERLEASGDLAGAEAEYKKSLIFQSKNPSALGALAYLYTTQARYPEAEAVLRKFIALEPQSAKAHVQLATVLFDSNQDQDAMKEASAASGLSASDARTLRQVAELYATHALYPEAAQQYSAVLRADPDDPDAHYGYGVVLMQQKHFSLAQKELQRAVELKPDFTVAYGDLAVAASKNGDFVSTIHALDSRGRYVSESAATYFLRATSYDHLKQFHDAAENYRKFLAADGGKNPDQEWQARHRLGAIDKK